MGFKDTFSNLLNYAMSRELPVEDTDYLDEDVYDMDFEDGSDFDFSDDAADMMEDRNSNYDFSDEKYSNTEYDYDDEFSADASEENSDGEDEVFMSGRAITAGRSSYRSSRRYSANGQENQNDISSERKDERKVVSMNSNSNLKVFLANPTAYEDCKDICSRVRSQMTVVVNLEKVKDQADRRRIFDFISGCSYALDCNFEKVSDMMYIIAPCNVDLFEEIAEEKTEAPVASTRRGAGSFTGILS